MRDARHRARWWASLPKATSAMSATRRSIHAMTTTDTHELSIDNL